MGNLRKVKERNVKKIIRIAIASINRVKTPIQPLLHRKVEKGRSAQKFATPAIHIANGETTTPSK